MRTIESMKSEKQKISQNIEKLRNRECELEKDIEQASMREIWEESIKHGVTTAADDDKPDITISASRPDEEWRNEASPCEFYFSCSIYHLD